MSASREKHFRQEQANSGWVDPKIDQEAQQRKKEKRNNALYAVIGIVFVIALAVSLVWRSNVIPRTVTAVTIDGENYSAAETAFYYQNVSLGFLNNNSYFLSYFGLDTSRPYSEQIMSDIAVSYVETEAGQTWHDYFMDTTLEQMATLQATLNEAESNGFVYPDSVQEQYNASMEALKATASASGISVDNYLATNFGSLITESIYGEGLLRLLKYDAYITAYSDSLTYTDAELEEAYSADTRRYDKVAYESVSISGIAESTTDANGNTVEPTEEEEAAAMEAAKKAAEQILADFRAGESLEALAEANEGASYTNSEGISYFSSDLLEWLFDDSRKAGDSAVVESGSTYYVVTFHARSRENNNTVDIRHILICPETGTLASDAEGYEEEQAQLKEAARAKADEILAQWEAGDATEESFAALAMEHSADGNAAEGGIYTQVYPGQMVETFNDWCFDTSRKPGDTGVVDTTYGSHVMYYVADNIPYWHILVSEDLKDQDFDAWTEDLVSDLSIEQHNFGMKFVG